MNSVLETVVVAGAVGGTLFWAVRAAVRSFRKGTVCSTCGDASSCPMAGKEQLPTELKDLDSGRACRR